MAQLARPAKFVLPLLQAALAADWPEVKIGTWTEDIDLRTFPIINVRRLGGYRNFKRPTKLATPVIELTAYGIENLARTEDLYDDALEALYDAVKRQTMTPVGHLSSMRETLGATQFDSPFQDSWRVQGLIQLGLRPLRTTN